MKTASEWFDAYSICHQVRWNIIIHRVCVPVILFSVIALLYSIPVPEALYVYPWVNGATLVIMLSWLFYANLGLKVLALMIFQMVIMYSGVLYLDMHFNIFQFGLTLFVVSWIVQFIGHKIEGKRPSFLQDLSFLLIGPAWVFKKLIGYK